MHSNHKNGCNNENQLDFQKKQKLIFHLNLKGWKVFPRFFNDKGSMQSFIAVHKIILGIHKITYNSAIRLFIHQ